MGIGNWIIGKAAERMAKAALPRFPPDGANLRVLVDDKIEEDYSQEIIKGLEVFKPIVKSVHVEKTTVPAKCWNQRRRQLDVTRLLLSRQGNLCLYIVKEDMYARSLNWAYGITYLPTGVSVVSLARYTNSDLIKSLGWSFTDEETRAVLVLEAQHEVGHLLGLKDHPKGQHASACVMNQTMHMEQHRTVLETVEHNSENGSGEILCLDCQARLNRFRNDLAVGNLKNYAERIMNLGDETSQ